MLDKTINITDKLINDVMIVFFLLLILIGGYALFDSYKIYDTVKLDAEIVSLKPKMEENYDFATLKELNEDIEGWITIFETAIDYPVLHSRDNLDYLNLNYKKEYTAGGSIFVDYRNAWNFDDDYTIVYGHNMMTGQMFSDIKKYGDTEYFNQHLYGALYTAEDIYKLEIIYLAKVNAFEDDIYNLITYANGRNTELVRLVEDRVEKINPVNSYDKLVLLSTCDSYASNDRMVLLAKLASSREEEIKEIEQQVKENITTIEDDGTVDQMGLPFGVWGLWWIILIIILILALIRFVRMRARKIIRKKNQRKKK